jgi:hypothetical protein
MKLNIAIIALVFAISAPRVHADAHLTDGLNRLAKEVATFLKKDGSSSINVGDFIAPPRLQASGGAGLSLEIAAALKQQSIDVRKDSPFQLIGQFTLRDEKADPSDSFESVALRIKASVLDKDDEELKKLSISVFGDAALQIAGGTTDLPQGLPPAAKEQKKRDTIDHPRAAIVGNETRSSGNSPFGIEVRARRGLSSESAPRTPEDDQGRAFVKLTKGEEYIVRLHNRAPFEAAVTLTIDGLTMFAFSNEGNFGSQVLVPSGKFIDIPGWYITSTKTDAFEITSYAKSAAASKGVPVTNMGTITATFHEAVDGSERDANATGRGRQIDQKYVEEKRVIKDAVSVVSVRYNR